MLVTFLSFLGCTDEDAPGDGLPPSCHPLRTAGVCASVFPAAHYLAADEATETGYRLQLGAEHFPVNAEGTSFDTAILGSRDGFSPSTHIYAVLPERLSSEAFPSLDDPAPSLLDESPTLLIDVERGERVLHFAELDAQVNHAEQHQALLIRPMRRLRHGTRYAVAIRRSLRRADGGPVSQMIAADELAPTLRAALEADGTAGDDLVLAWEFVTASRNNTVRDVSSMVDQTLAQLGDDGLGYTIESIDEGYSSTVARRVRGTFIVPRFTSHSDPGQAEIEMLRDEQGLPRAEGTYEAPFVLLVPRSANETAPARLAIYGHGFVNTAAGAYGEPDNERFPQRFGDSHGYAFIGTDWWGLSTAETASGVLPAAIEDINKITWLSDRLKQAVVNHVVLARTAKAIAADATVTGGAEIIETGRVDYLGISLGGIMGSVLLPYSPDIERAVFHVSAASWSTLLQRSKLWGLFQIFVDQAYPSPLDQLQLISALQLLFDDVEGLTLADEIRDRARVLFQVGANDDTVSNVASAMLARTMNLGLLDDSPMDIADITAVSGEQPSALTVWDPGAPAPPSSNTANDPTDPNDVHETLRELPALMAQMDVFLRTGVVSSTCEDTCDPE